MQMFIVMLPISMLLFFVLFFGIGFILNMLLRMTWIMAFIYPIVVIFIVDKVRFFDYFTNPGKSFHQLFVNISNLQLADILILSSGLLGAIGSGLAMKILRKRGYRMF